MYDWLFFHNDKIEPVDQLKASDKSVIEVMDKVNQYLRVGLVFKLEEGGKTEFYYVDMHERLVGVGASGTVRLARKVDDTGTIVKNIAADGLEDKSQCKAAKFINLYESDYHIQREYLFLKRFYPTHLVKYSLNSEQYRVIFTPHLLDEQLFSGWLDLDLNPKVKRLSFVRRVDIIQKLLLQVIRMHNITNSGSAFTHCDLKGSNIRVRVTDIAETTEVAIIDYNISCSVADPDSLHKGLGGGGTPGYQAPEVEKGNLGTKSDVYTLAIVFSGILEISDKSADGKLKIDCIRDSDLIPERIQRIIIEFLSRMFHNNYDKRPHTNEILPFFNAVRNYCDSTAEQTKFYCWAKLELLNAGLWKDAYDFDIKNYGKAKLIVNCGESGFIYCQESNSQKYFGGMDINFLTLELAFRYYVRCEIPQIKERIESAVYKYTSSAKAYVRKNVFGFRHGFDGQVRASEVLRQVLSADDQTAIWSIIKNFANNGINRQGNRMKFHFSNTFNK